jgi:hypothetical protein
MTLDQMMLRKGFEPTDTGPYVTELRKITIRQMSEGLTNASYGSWAPGEHSAEDRAKALLELDWAIQQGHYHEVKNLDSGWRRPISKIGDMFREFGYNFRKQRSKRLGLKNPFSK